MNRDRCGFRRVRGSGPPAPRVGPSRRGQRRSAWVLLETVIATGLLIVALAVIGVQMQDSRFAILTMQREAQALMLAEMHLAETDLGLVEFESANDIEEGDFGPRYPDWGWRESREQTAVEDLYEIRLDILHVRRDGDYREDDFNYDDAERITTMYALRPAPRQLDFGIDFGLTEDEVNELSDQLTVSGIPGLDPQSFDPAVLAKLDFDEFVEALPVIMTAFRIDYSDIASSLPKDVLQQLQESGVFGEEDGGRTQTGGSRGNSGNE